MQGNTSVQPVASGPSPHVRAVGPHGHQWAEVGLVGDQVYRECSFCGARNVALLLPTGETRPLGPLADRCAQAAWLAGGEWVGEGSRR